MRGDATALEFPDGRFSGAASFTMLTTYRPWRFRTSSSLRSAGYCAQAVGSLSATAWRALNLSSPRGDTYNPIDPEGLAERLEVRVRRRGGRDEPIRGGPLELGSDEFAQLGFLVVSRVIERVRKDADDASGIEDIASPNDISRCPRIPTFHDD